MAMRASQADEYQIRALLLSTFMLSFEQSLHSCTYDAPGFAGGARWLPAPGFPRVGGILFLL